MIHTDHEINRTTASKILYVQHGQFVDEELLCQLTVDGRERTSYTLKPVCLKLTQFTVIFANGECVRYNAL